MFDCVYICIKFNRNIIALSLRYQQKLVCKETNSPGCDSISFNFLSNFTRNNAQFSVMQSSFSFSDIKIIAVSTGSST